MKLYIPGPTHVERPVLDALATYPLGHRTPEFRELHRELEDGVSEVLDSTGRILFSTSSGTGLMEASVRNLTRRRVANFICGAFSQRMADITRSCGIAQDSFAVDWGQPNTPAQVERALQTGRYDVVTIVHNETSTGVMNPLQEIAAVVARYPEVLLVVDAVSSMMGVPIRIDDWQIDVVLASVQKAWALPPGFSLIALSETALQRAGVVSQSQRGYYFDFIRMARAGEKHQTPITPSIPHLYALRKQLERIREEGLERRFTRHAEMAEFVRAWGRDRFGLFAAPGAESQTLTCFGNAAKVDLVELVERVRQRGSLISGGYGDLKGKTFRLAHMGDLQLEDLRDITTIIDEELDRMA